MRNGGPRAPHGLEAGHRLQRLRLLDRLQRGDDPLHPGPRLADPSGPGEHLVHLDQRLPAGRPTTARRTSYFPPLFGHQYSHCWIDFRGHPGRLHARPRASPTSRTRAGRPCAQQAYCIANPGGWAGYGDVTWGLTASDDPDGYLAHGAPPAQNDDGTITPTAAASSIAFAPEVVIPTLHNLYDTYGVELWGEYGFKDAFNLTAILVGHRLHRHRPGSDHHHDRELPERCGLEPLHGESRRRRLAWSRPASRRSRRRPDASRFAAAVVPSRRTPRIRSRHRPWSPTAWPSRVTCTLRLYDAARAAACGVSPERARTRAPSEIAVGRHGACPAASTSTASGVAMATRAWRRCIVVQ